MILYIENPKYFTEKLLELINEVSKVAGHKINIQKSVEFLYTNNKVSEKEIKKAIPFTVQSKTNKQKIPREKFNQGGERPIH